MLKFALERLSLAFASLLAVSIATFCLMHALPGGPFEDKYFDPLAKEMLLEERGLNKSLPRQYLDWVGSMLHGNWGTSTKTGRPIAQTIQTCLPRSVALGALSLLLSSLVGISLGCIAALNKGKPSERIITSVTSLITSLPLFLVGAVLLISFAIKLKWVNYWGTGHTSLFLPVLTLALGPCAYITRVTQSAVGRTLESDYCKCAQMKGASPTRAVIVHALPNALSEIIAYIASQAGYILSGSLVVESIFNIGGFGGKLTGAILERDYALIMAATIIYSTFAIISSFVSVLCGKALVPSRPEEQ